VRAKGAKGPFPPAALTPRVVELKVTSWPGKSGGLRLNDKV